MLDELKSEEARRTAIQLGIPTDFVKKDFFVTRVIQTLTRIEDEYFTLVFQGGTSLSKGYQVIARLSEDVDFRVILRPAAEKLGKGMLRKRLRDFRYSLVRALKEAEFKVPEETIKVFYEGHFMKIQAEYAGSQEISYLKPHVSIECFLGELALAPKPANITSLIKLTLGNACDHANIPVICVALDETAAEKWVALTRRVAGTQIKPRESDKHLVRHLYDLYHLQTSNLLSGDYRDIVYGVIEKDKAQFKKHNDSYVSNPLQVSKMTLDMLLEDKKWQTYWHVFLEQMVYEKDKPNFEMAYRQLQVLSDDIFASLEVQ